MLRMEMENGYISTAFPSTLPFKNLLLESTSKQQNWEDKHPKVGLLRKTLKNQTRLGPYWEIGI